MQIVGSESNAACAKLVSGVAGEGQILVVETSPTTTSTLVLGGGVQQGSNLAYEVDFDATAEDFPPSSESSVFNSDLTANFHFPAQGTSLPVTFYSGSGSVSNLFKSNPIWRV